MSNCTKIFRETTKLKLCFLFSFSGYGGISIKTHTRIAALLYALFGIPLVLLYLSVMGDGLATVMRCMFRQLRTCGTKRGRSESGSSSQSSGNNSNSSSTTGIGTINGRPDNATIIDKSFHNASSIAASLKAAKLSKANQNYDNNYGSQMYNYNTYYRHSNGVPVSISIMIIICYITLGAALFHRIQTWNVLESIYFCFTSLGTIGFGELEPKGTVAQYAAGAYILIGLSVVAMCFNLIRTEIAVWLRRFDGHDRNGGGSASDEKSHATTISGAGNGRNVGTGAIPPNNFTHLMPHHNHLMHHQLPSSAGPIEDVALVTVAVAPKS